MIPRQTARTARTLARGFPIVALTGPRQSGKTTLARTLFSDHAYVSVTHRFNDCRDPRDNQLLELAVSGAAQVIITGDSDLLALHPFRQTLILTPTSYLDWSNA